MILSTARVIDLLAASIYEDNRAVGWWDKPREDGTLIALMHSELSEAMEAVRKDLMDEHLPHHKGVTVELADCIIRILDYCGAMNLPVGTAIMEKLAYNKVREDHKREIREQDNGKRF